MQRPFPALHSLPSFARRASLWRAAYALAAVIVLCLMQKPFFYTPANDGFTVGMLFIDGVSFSKLFENPLNLVHALRYVAAFLPWTVHEYTWAPLVNALFITALVWPLTSIPLRDAKAVSPWRVLLFFLPCFISLRSVMVTVGIGYLFILVASNCRSRLMYAVSALCANLSSASVFIWLVLSAANLRHLLALRWAGMLVMLVMAGSLTVSVADKYAFFNHQAALAYTEPDQAGSSGASVYNWLMDVSGIESVSDVEHAPWWLQQAFVVATVVDRSTIAISIYKGDYSRALGYVGLLFLYVYVLAISLRGGEFGKTIRLFLIVCLPLFLTEGLGVLSMVAPIVLYLLECDAPLLIGRNPCAWRWHMPSCLLQRDAGAS